MIKSTNITQICDSCFGSMECSNSALLFLEGYGKFIDGMNFIIKEVRRTV